MPSDLSENIVPRLKPEEDELLRKREELAAIRVTLAELELELVDLRSQLTAFAGRYLRQVGTLYAELDEWKARISEWQARFDPSTASKAQAEDAREQARQTHEEAHGETSEIHDFTPSPELRMMYREVAKRIHPDFAADAAETLRMPGRQASVLMFPWICRSVFCFRFQGRSPDSALCVTTGLMFAEIIHKLWNRGIDIGVGVITSVIVGLIGLAFWRAKLWLDLRADEQKQRQQQRISSELEAQRTEAATRAWRQKLPIEREHHAAAAETAASYPELAHCWVNYVLWLRSNQLSELPGNLRVLNQHGDDGRHIMSVATHEGLTAMARSTADIIRNTELPHDS